MKRTKSKYLALVAVLLTPMAANADSIGLRIDLDSLLGAGAVTEDFESFVLADGGAVGAPERRTGQLFEAPARPLRARPG